MPFDGIEKDWEPRPSKRRWYVVEFCGQKKGRKRWCVETFDGEGWWPLFSFYAQTKREANGVASWAMWMAYP